MIAPRYFTSFSHAFLTCVKNISLRDVYDATKREFVGGISKIKVPREL